jgi:nucleotide-binding universal stress UspA family protein
METIVVGVDGSPQAKAAADRAAQLAAALGGALHIVSAVPKVDQNVGPAGPDGTWLLNSVDLAERAVEELAAEYRSTIGVTTVAVHSDPAPLLCNEAARIGASIIVVGNKRVQGISRVLGSIAGDVAKSAPCDVYIVHTYD